MLSGGATLQLLKSEQPAKQPQCGENMKGKKSRSRSPPAPARPSVRPSESVFPSSTAANLIADIDHHLFCQNLTTIRRSSGGTGEAINANGLNIIERAARERASKEKADGKSSPKPGMHFRETSFSARHRFYPLPYFWFKFEQRTGPRVSSDPLQALAPYPIPFPSIRDGGKIEDARKRRLRSASVALMTEVPQEGIPERRRRRSGEPKI